MKLLTKQQRTQMIKNHEQQDGTKSFDCVVKLFNPVGLGTWYLSELNPETNVAYGLCVITEAEYGYVDLNELSSTPVGMGLGIERDIMFPSGLSLQECLTIQMRQDGC